MAPRSDKGKDKMRAGPPYRRAGSGVRLFPRVPVPVGFLQLCCYSRTSLHASHINKSSAEIQSRQIAWQTMRSTDVAGKLLKEHRTLLQQQVGVITLRIEENAAVYDLQQLSVSDEPRSRLQQISDILLCI